VPSRGSASPQCPSVCVTARTAIPTRPTSLCSMWVVPSGRDRHHDQPGQGRAVHVGVEHVADGMVRAVIVNSGNANACTGAGARRRACDDRVRSPLRSAAPRATSCRCRPASSVSRCPSSASSAGPTGSCERSRAGRLQRRARPRDDDHRQRPEAGRRARRTRRVAAGVVAGRREGCRHDRAGDGDDAERHRHRRAARPPTLVTRSSRPSPADLQPHQRRQLRLDERHGPPDRDRDRRHADR
jgi:hypothetical protein